MKAKNQQPITSELDAKEKLIVYVYEYLVHSGAKTAASTFKETIGYSKEIKINESPGFLVDWWCVFWDLYCAAPDRRMALPEPSAEARAFHDYRVTPISPSITHPSPPQHPSQQPHAPQFMGGPRGYGPPPGGPHPRGPPPRMQGGPPPHPQHQVPPHAGAGFMPSGSPRYTQHPPGPPQQPPPHMNQGPGGPMFGPGPDQMGPSPGLNRMTPGGGPPQQVVGGPPQGGPPQMVGMSGQPQIIGGPPVSQGGPLVPPQMNSMQPPPRNGSQGSSQGGGGSNANGWPQGNVNYGNVNSPANQPCYTPTGPGSNQGPNQGGGPTMTMMTDAGMMEVKSSPVNGAGEPSTPHPDEYVMPVPFGQDTSDQCDSAEILKIKQSMQEDSSKIFDKDQTDFGIADSFPDNQGWK